MNKVLDEIKLRAIALGMPVYFNDELNDNEVVVVIENEKVINGYFEMKVTSVADGLDLMYYYNVDDKGILYTSQRVDKVMHLVNYFNNYMDITDNLALHTFVIDEEHRDLYLHCYYNSALLAAKHDAVIDDIFNVQVKRMASYCLPIIAMLCDRATPELAWEKILEIRDGEVT